MEKAFLQFNNGEIAQITDFFYDTNSVLYVEAPLGALKHKILNSAFQNFSDDYFEFYHFCNKFTVIEDLLLSFYDTLRNYSLAQKIQLKKSMASDFTQKVRNYLNSLDKKTFVILDNFEKILEDATIAKFIAELSENRNIKIILLSNSDLSLWGFKNAFMRYKTINLKKQNINIFNQKISLLFDDISDEMRQKLIKYTGLEDFWLLLTKAYVAATENSLSEFFSDFERKNELFQDFIISRTLTLIPDTYSDFIKTMCFANFPVSKNLMECYKIGDIGQVDYLKKRLILSEINNSYFLNEHIKNYFKNILSIGEKIKFGTIFLDIFNSELAKNPKERFTRLSREGINKQSENIRSNIPKLNEKVLDSASLDFISHVQKSIAPWYVKDLPKNSENETKSEDNIILKKFREENFKKKSILEMVQKTDRISAILEEAKTLKAEKNFDEAIGVLKNFALKNTDNELGVLIDEQIAQNYIEKNELNEAVNYYLRVCDFYNNTSKPDKYSEFLLKVANVYKGLKKFDASINCYEKILKNSNLADKSVITSAYFSLADIYEKSGDDQKTIDILRNLLVFLGSTDDKNSYCKANYRLALLYERQNDIKNAKCCYLECVKSGEIDAITGDCYLNLALIFVDENDILNADNYFKLAIKQFENEDIIDFSGLYWANLSLAHLYKNKNQELYIKYLLDALSCAQKAEDNFEIASVIVEIGDFYYYKNENDKALIEYLKAKKILNEPFDTQNMQMIFMRIEDMRLKMGLNEFERVALAYEQGSN